MSLINIPDERSLSMGVLILTLPGLLSIIAG